MAVLQRLLECEPSLKVIYRDEVVETNISCYDFMMLSSVYRCNFVECGDRITIDDTLVCRESLDPFIELCQENSVKLAGGIAGDVFRLCEAWQMPKILERAVASLVASKGELLEFLLSGKYHSSVLGTEYNGLNLGKVFVDACWKREEDLFKKLFSLGSEQLWQICQSYRAVIRDNVSVIFPFLVYCQNQTSVISYIFKELFDATDFSLEQLEELLQHPKFDKKLWTECDLELMRQNLELQKKINRLTAENQRLSDRISIYRRNSEIYGDESID